MTNSARLRVVLACLAALCLAWGGRAADESAAARLERHDNLVEGLNATSAGRAATLDLINNELRGPNRREMREVLRESLGRTNILIVQGVVEALALMGDSQDLSAVEALLATSGSMEVKVLTIRLLPAFCLPGSERGRYNFIRYASGYDRVAPPGVLEPLRQPPLSRRGRLDAAREGLQTRVARAVAGQFDPVAAAIASVDDLLYGPAARNAVTHFVGSALGRDPSAWASVWADQSGLIAILVPDELEEIRLAALQALADMGAEAQPGILRAFAAFMDSDVSPIVRQAAFDCLAAMCDSGFAVFLQTDGMRFEAGNVAAAAAWRTRRTESSARLAVFAADRAASALDPGLDAGTFASAAGCLGRALAYPSGLPDPAGELAAARDGGVAALERLLLHPDPDREKRTALAEALGRIGTGRAVAAVAGILASPYCAPGFGPDAPRLADAATDSLASAASGGGSGAPAAREALLSLLSDPRLYPPPRPEAPPVGAAHMALWRLQRLARSTEISFDADFWRERLGW